MPSVGGVDSTASDAVLERWPMVGRRADVERVMRSITDPRTSGAVVVGGPGLGKTRLADEVLTEAQSAGLRVLRATASESARPLPLGALAHLLPPDTVLAEAEAGSLDPVRLLAHARKAISGDTTGRVVLVIDDVQHLDAVSAALLAQLVAEDSAALVLTVRDGERLPDTVAGFQRAERLVTVELVALPDTAVDTLLHLGLGAPVEGRTSAGFRVASAGNPWSFASWCAPPSPMGCSCCATACGCSTERCHAPTEPPTSSAAGSTISPTLSEPWSRSSPWRGPLDST